MYLLVVVPKQMWHESVNGGKYMCLHILLHGLNLTDSPSLQAQFGAAIRIYKVSPFIAVYGTIT